MVRGKVKEKVKKRKRATPKWVELLLGRRFFDVCDAHKELRKSEVNIFCTECSESMCPHCLASSSSPHRYRHDGHHFLQIRRYVYQDVIRVHDMHKYVDCSKVQSFTVNGARVVLLNPKRQTKPATQQGSGVGPLCRVCQRAVPEPNRYCSIACKVEDTIKVEDTDSGSGSEPDPSERPLTTLASDADESASPKGGCGGEPSPPSSPNGSDRDGGGGGGGAKKPLKKRGVSRRKGVPRRAQFF